MLNAHVIRNCEKCGVYPVMKHNQHAGKICERCFLGALLDLMFEPQEPFKCPGCETIQDITTEPPFICPGCGWHEFIDGEYGEQAKSD